MSIVNITNINVLSNPASITDSLQFEITFECLSNLESDLEFKIIYVGSAEDEKLDQVLDSIMVGPVPVGVNKFVFEADPPNLSLIPKSELIGVTVVLITCSYKNREFVRVGYYTNTDYASEELRENPPENIDMSLLQRTILADQPRVTRFAIPWDGDDEIPNVTVNEEEGNFMEDDGLISDEDEAEEEEEEEDEEDGSEEVDLTASDQEMEEDVNDENVEPLQVDVNSERMDLEMQTV
ncbi:anti-silence-domain-containing protein [Rozella allomycis CSF55]|uniref:Histone chaperone n=1 Tax=Rozella allomycis (strain CSF55) TaxID=988480 RepID=A0A075AZU7_ROZAC|nr:Histone deposition protein Asf1 domain-containing protein [Rozella allomycis CSF55]RKP20507.1 anti-silence-domain-containing protein [Rozella allomycis CSF55]|eukprot:EPZ34222.1 Histone deposition protein Asf1 domain-containing protein [Rozella allomycis CSF55]